MEQISKRLLIYMLEMGIFYAFMILGIMYGPQHPQFFFWGILMFFAAVLVIEVRPTAKDTFLLAVGTIVFAIAGTNVDKFVGHFFGDNILIGFTVEAILLAPFFFPLFNHFLKMCAKMVIRLKGERFESPSK